MREDVRVVVFMHAKRGEESAIKQACEAAVAHTWWEAGCDEFSLHRGIENQSLFVVVGHWKSERALFEHMGSPQYEALKRELNDKLTQPMQTNLLRQI